MVRKGFLIPQTPSHVTFFLKWVFFPLFFQWKQLFSESRLKGPVFITDNSETVFLQKPATLQPRNPTGSSLALLDCCRTNTIPSSFYKIKIHHRHSIGYIFVLGTGSYIAICGCEQWVEVTEPAFQNKVRVDGRQQMLSSVMQRISIDFHSFIFRCNHHQFLACCMLLY